MTTHDEVVPRPDWRDSLALAADLALLGILTSLACLPIVTAGAALATASAAVDHACVHRGLPSFASLGRTFARALLPGLGAAGVAAGAGLLLAIDVQALRTGAVPGGWPMLAVTLALTLFGAALAVLALVRVGETGGRGWLAALRWAAGQPVAGVLLLLTMAVPVGLAFTVPAVALLMPGFLLFALHVVARRFAAVSLPVGSSAR